MKDLHYGSMADNSLPPMSRKCFTSPTWCTHIPIIQTIKEVDPYPVVESNITEVL